MIAFLIWNMFISELECLERGENHSLTSRCRFKNPEANELGYVLEFKIETRASRVRASLIDSWLI